MVIQEVTPPAVEPLSLAEIKRHVRVEWDFEDDDTYLRALIKAVRFFAENYTGAALVKRTYDYWLDYFPPGTALLLPRPPLSSVSTLAYTDYEGTVATMSLSTDYTEDSPPALVSDPDLMVDTDSTPGRLVLAWGKVWPTTTLNPVNPIRIRFTAGYADDAGSPADYRVNIPADLKHGMYLILADWYNQREDNSIGVPIFRMTRPAEALLNQYRHWRV